MTARRGLTQLQAEALRFIGSFIAGRGYSPTYAEICVGLGKSPKSRSTMHYRIQRLRARGYLVTQDRCRQTIMLTADGVAYCKDFPSPSSPGARQQPQQTKPPARPLETVTEVDGQGRRAGIHFRRMEGEA